MKKIVLGLASAGLALATFGPLSPMAEAAKCNSAAQDKPTSGNQAVASAPNGTTIYSSPGTGTSGYAGARGDTGYLEGKGSTSGGEIRGHTSNGAVNGRVQGDAGGLRVCVNDTDIKTP